VEITILSESLKPSESGVSDYNEFDFDEIRRDWLGYATEQDEEESKHKYRTENTRTDQEEKNTTIATAVSLMKVSSRLSIERIPVAVRITTKMFLRERRRGYFMEGGRLELKSNLY